MTPAQAVASLDRHLARHGADVVLRRVQPGGPVDVTVRAHVRGYTPHELTGSVVMGDTKAIISPTQIIAAGWSGASTDGTDARVPVRGDKLVIAGRLRNIEAAAPIYMAGELVRIELQVRG
ncbi:hypothetical protein [Ancylobacter defluvii]|uniref:Uncharacterized protein n=1 Tax=Ancylobacter defluvii TaxID=1282440 RepID=A0A9W6ND97_9HYPH|nr:hypothetical protein [Ancylobacter defluvii]MBS7588287.1 hypothetical protein [Ancylobacter defluvii]GLK86683.1 hypothetical protein GCM10017653_47530 [Ancylobacter defluvii]